MAVLITEKIQLQNFEIIKDKLGVILFEELINQKRTQCAEFDLEVFIERQEPYDDAEDVVVNITENNISYSSIDSNSSQGNISFDIDIYASGNATIDIDGNTNVRRKLDIVKGWIRYILSSTKYQTLGFPKGFIGGTYVNSIQNDKSYGSQDGSFVRVTTINFTVRASENQEMWDGLGFTGNDTVIKLDNGTKGYKLIFNT
tara:strand:+ start:1664 stop:2266 length:603 start_codon:yes stop_codon:yes gene_type:complete